MPRYSLLILLLLLVDHCFGQQGFLRVTPQAFTSVVTYSQKVIESPGNTIELMPAQRFKNANWNTLNTNIQFDFLCFGNKLTAGIMVGTCATANGYGFYYFPHPAVADSGSYYNCEYTLTTGSRRLDVGTTWAYHLPKRIDSPYRWRQTIQAGLLFSITRTTGSSANYSAYHVYDGILNYSDSTDNEIPNRLGIALSLRYEWELLSKRKQRNVFTFFIGYRQGFVAVDRAFYGIHHSNGMDVRITSTSRSSAFFIGIAKPITFIQPFRDEK